LYVNQDSFKNIMFKTTAFLGIFFEIEIFDNNLNGFVTFDLTDSKLLIQTIMKSLTSTYLNLEPFFSQCVKSFHIGVG